MHAPFVEEGACFPAQGNLGVAARSYSSEGVCFLPERRGGTLSRLKLLRELKDKYIIVDENGSPTTVAKTPYNVMKYGYLEGKPTHAKSVDGYSVDESSEAESDEALIITSPDGVGVPLLAGKFGLALNLLNGKPIGEIWKRNYDLILKKLDVKKD